MSLQVWLVIEWEPRPRLVGPFANHEQAEQFLEAHLLTNATYELMSCVPPASFKEDLRVLRLRDAWKQAVENNETEDGFSTWVRQHDAQLRQVKAKAQDEKLPAQDEKLPAPEERADPPDQQEIELPQDLVVEQQVARQLS